MVESEDQYRRQLLGIVRKMIQPARLKTLAVGRDCSAVYDAMIASGEIARRRGSANAAAEKLAGLQAAVLEADCAPPGFFGKLARQEGPPRPARGSTCGAGSGEASRC